MAARNQPGSTQPHTATQGKDDTMNAPRGIPTTYRGTLYRSRTEARYAAFFDQIGWTFTYEPFDGKCYIPDFLIHGEQPLVVEVKFAVTESDYRAPIRKIERGLRGAYNADILILGADPLPGLSSTFGSTYPAAGMLGEHWEPETGLPSDYSAPHWTWASGLWMTCNECGAIGIFHEYQSYAGRPCGHHDGDHYLGAIDTQRIQAAWNHATNQVRWEGHR